MTNVQWQKLIDLLGNPSSHNNNDRLSGETSKTFWLIDSGASHHVIGHLALLHNVHDVSECNWSS